MKDIVQNGVRVFRVDDGGLRVQNLIEFLEHFRLHLLEHIVYILIMQVERPPVNVNHVGDFPYRDVLNRFFLQQLRQGETKLPFCFADTPVDFLFLHDRSPYYLIMDKGYDY